MSDGVAVSSLEQDPATRAATRTTRRRRMGQMNSPPRAITPGETRRGPKRRLNRSHRSFVSPPHGPRSRIVRRGHPPPPGGIAHAVLRRPPDRRGPRPGGPRPDVDEVEKGERDGVTRGVDVPYRIQPGPLVGPAAPGRAARRAPPRTPGPPHPVAPSRPMPSPCDRRWPPCRRANARRSCAATTPACRWPSVPR